jgi:predicted hotdog family 3-hydroxylacyl-ACP dehydratase
MTASWPRLRSRRAQPSRRRARTTFVALEVAAQAAAAFEALRRRRAGAIRPRVGYLVGARDAVLQIGLPVGLPLQVTIRLDAALPPLSTYLFEVGAGGAVAANGTISTYMA